MKKACRVCLHCDLTNSTPFFDYTIHTIQIILNFSILQFVYLFFNDLPRDSDCPGAGGAGDLPGAGVGGAPDRADVGDGAALQLQQSLSAGGG